MSEFTKGDWEVVYAGPAPIGVGVAMKGNSICTAYDMILNPVFKGKTDDDLPQIIADMQLAAASKDMYEALKGTGGTPNISMVLKQIEMRRFDVAKSMLEEMDELNNKALAKAEGKEL